MATKINEELNCSGFPMEVDLQKELKMILDLNKVRTKS